MTKKAHIVHMDEQRRFKEIKKWVRRVGGIRVAKRLIRDVLLCSGSKAEKIAGCRYPSYLPPLEEMALASLIGKPREVVFPVVGRKAS